MVFSSVTFLCLFLPVFLITYLPGRNVSYKNIVLVVFSLLFYAWGEPVWVAALLVSALTDYICGLAIEKHRGDACRKIALTASLVINLGMLSTFKYSGFVIENINAILHTSIPGPAFNLPLGISFYTFQTLSYTIDVYRGKVKVQRNFLNFLCYVTMFPQLVAGPIVRYSGIEDDLTSRKVTRERFSAGISRFAIGLAKKTLLANPAGAAAAALLTDTAMMTSASAWLGIIMFAFQLYFDFSGYSDMAIGIGKMIGFDFPENFNYPYEARSITDFWRRWHMSLVSFFRDYLYIPLGGNRKHAVRNIAVVWLLTGLWHGAGWNFILWGALNGALLLLERYVLRGTLAKTPVLIARCYTMIAILFGYGVFYYSGFPELLVFIKAFFFINTPLSGFLAETVLANNIWIIIVMAIASTSIPKRVIAYIYEVFPEVSLSEPVFATAGTLVCMFMLLGQTYNPFLYFRF